MRAVAFSVWIFINLAFLGMGGYIYLILSTYWCRETRQGQTQPLIHKKMKFVRENQVVFYEPKIRVESKSNAKIMDLQIFKSAKPSRSVFKKINRMRRRSTFEVCKNGFNCTDLSQLKKTKLEKFKDKLFIQLRRVLHDESNVFKTDNPYFVNYIGPRERYQALTSSEIKCRLKKAGLRLLTENDPPISSLKSWKISKGEFLDGKTFKTCAIVSSAGSMLNSRLGKLIGT